MKAMLNSKKRKLQSVLQMPAQTHTPTRTHTRINTLLIHLVQPLCFVIHQTFSKHYPAHGYCHHSSSARPLKHRTAVLFNIWLRASIACLYHIILSHGRTLAFLFIFFSVAEPSRSSYPSRAFEQLLLCFPLSGKHRQRLNYWPRVHLLPMRTRTLWPPAATKVGPAFPKDGKQGRLKSFWDPNQIFTLCALYRHVNTTC